MSRRTRSFGAASVATLLSAALDDGMRTSEAVARSALPFAEFLDDEWFWLRDQKRNPLSTLACRILAVASPLDVTTIRAGVCRTYRRREALLVPPARVMQRYYEMQETFVVDEQGRVRPEDQFDCESELGATDRIFIDVLRSSWTGVLDRRSLHDACVAQGMSTGAFSFAATYSPVLANPERDVWCLRGTRISPVTVAALRHAKASNAGTRRGPHFGPNRQSAL